MTTDLGQIENRHTSVSRTGFSDIHEALAWVVNTYDREFTGQEFVKIHVGQYETVPLIDTEDDPPTSVWYGCVSGGRDNTELMGDH